MDHLPLPLNPTIGTIEVPFVCTKQYDGGPFKQWPRRQGIELQSYQRRITFKKNGQYIVDFVEIGSLMQTWLYFGLLREFIDKDIDYSQFEKSSSGTQSLLLSSRALPEIVGRRSVEIAESEWAQDSSQLATWKDHIYSCLFETGDLIDLVGVFCGMYPETVLTPVCLSIGVLAEYLMRALSDVCTAKNHPLPRTLLFRLGIGDVAAPILRLMKERGWCPNHLDFFNEQSAYTIGMLWYYANVELPQSSAAHKDCTIKQCLALQVDEQNYRTAHMTDQCDCQFVGLRPEELAEKVRAGALPLFNIVDSEASDIELALSSPTDENGENEFVAISHVWADGFGNPVRNQLPACVLRYIQRAANDAPRRNPHKDMKIWMDTICLPVSPLDLRHQALTKMNDPYRKATYVLVLDRYLRRLDAEGMSPAEIVARIVVSGWHQRLWTLAEARLANHVIFAFRRSLEDMATHAQRHREKCWTLPSLPDNYVQSNVISSYTTSKVVVENEKAKYHEKQIPGLRAALSTRATSRASDESLCLGLILGLDLSPILEADDNEKMVLIWKSFENIPVGLVFSKALPKLCAKGCRWAPSSIMSVPEDIAWRGPSALLFTELRAQPVAQGLKFVQPTIFWRVPPSNSTIEAKKRLLEICCPPDPKAGKLDLWLKDAQGRWFLGSIDEAWHQDSSSIDVESEIPAIIVTESIQATKITKPFEDARPAYQFGTQIYGLFVTFDSSQENVSERRAKAHRHIVIQQVSEQESKEYEGLQKCAERMLAERPDIVEQIRTISMTAIQSHPDQFTAFIENFARTHDLIEPGRLTRAHRGVQQTDQVILMYFNIVVKYFLCLRDYVQIVEDSSPIPWIID